MSVKTKWIGPLAIKNLPYTVFVSQSESVNRDIWIEFPAPKGYPLGRLSCTCMRIQTLCRKISSILWPAECCKYLFEESGVPKMDICQHWQHQTNYQLPKTASEIYFYKRRWASSWACGPCANCWTSQRSSCGFEWTQALRPTVHTVSTSECSTGEIKFAPSIVCIITDKASPYNLDVHVEVVAFYL